MWNILKGDFSYYKSGTCILYGMGMIFFMMAAVWNLIDIYIMSGTLVILFWLMAAIMGANEDKEKHIRRHSLLPVSVKEIGKARLLFLLFLQGGIFLMWMVLLVIERGEHKGQILRDLLVMNAMVLIVVNIFSLYHDLKYSASTYWRFILVGGIITLLIIFILLDIADIMSYPLNFNSCQPKSLTDVIIFNLVCIILFWWDYRIFLKRKSFIE